MMRSTVFIIQVFYTIFSIIIIDNTAANVSIINRGSWGAVGLKNPPTPLQIKPPQYVIITQTNSNPCADQRQCTDMVRNMQNMAINQYKKNDIEDNFIIGGDGNVYEGRGWDIQPEEDHNYNRKSIFITFIGDYSKIKPSTKQIDSVLHLLKFGHTQKKLHDKYKLLGFRQISHNVFPGAHLFEIIKKWQHWVPIP